ncbi:hypothetical protein Aple_095040 [Acrocarpospora pleiomorpha]|uniref:SCP domain-containing protein n=1 Tax=Acrocarpospora pleiomorpha TaxID=90975 RepID=A0A5M3XZS5_9ACTN|nr:CAP domain-containing protein [Acrocarpospora pleiomorpha]GES26605.1 hypothetical protein Aple_095040 [Acrocarpospora pleiomorpha]
MSQPPHTRHTQWTSRRGTLLGLVACVTAVLLLGIVIGRLTMTPAGTDEVFLRNNEPNPQAKASTTPAPAKRRHLSALAPVARVVTPDTTPATGQVATPGEKPRNRPDNMIDGSYGGDQTSTHNGDELSSDSGSLVTLENEVVALVNAERAKKNGCVPLRIDQRLVQSARTHSAEMAASGSFVHESPNGATPWQRMARAGYQHGGAENIARGYQTAQEAVRGWMASSTHRGNILNCRLTATGVGVTLGPEGPWWTQDFGYP